MILHGSTGRIQPTIIKGIGCVLSLLKEGGDVAVVLAERYLDIALGSVDRLRGPDYGRITVSSARNEISSKSVRGLVTT